MAWCARAPGHNTCFCEEPFCYLPFFFITKIASEATTITTIATIKTIRLVVVMRSPFAVAQTVQL